MTFANTRSAEKSREIGQLRNAVRMKDAKIERLEATIAVLKKRLNERTSK